MSFTRYRLHFPHKILPPLLFLITSTLTSSAFAQDGDPSPFRSFDEFTVERIRPEQIPDYRPGLPQGSSTQSLADLPRALSSEQMRRVARTAQSTTMQIIAVHTPPKPYRSAPLIYRGHALWTSPHEDGSQPLLITTADWLDEADSIYLFTPDQDARSAPNHDVHLSPAPHQPFQQHSVANQNFIDDHADELTPLFIERADRHFNLAHLAAHDPEQLSPPSKGLILHNMDHTMPGAIFGYSPDLGTTILPLNYIRRKLDDSLSFYFLTDFSAILGAPILGAEAQLLAISALRHPEKPAWSLAIPPGAIHAFLGTKMASQPDEETSQ